MVFLNLLAMGLEERNASFYRLVSVELFSGLSALLGIEFIKPSLSPRMPIESLLRAHKVGRICHIPNIVTIDNRIPTAFEPRFAFPREIVLLSHRDLTFLLRRIRQRLSQIGSPV
jgi:hypothetical protein